MHAPVEMDKREWACWLHARFSWLGGLPALLAQKKKKKTESGRLIRSGWGLAWGVRVLVHISRRHSSPSAHLGWTRRLGMAAGSPEFTRGSVDYGSSKNVALAVADRLGYGAIRICCYVYFGSTDHSTTGNLPVN